MSKEVLAVDVDEVFKPFLHNFLADYNSRYDTDHRVSDFYTYDFESHLELDIPESVSRIYDFMSTDHSHIEPLEGAEEAIERLKNRFDIEVITARHPQFRQVTEGWLTSKMGDFYSGINLIAHPLTAENVPTKAEVCIKLGAVALVDDSLGHIQECSANGVEGILFGDYPWNQSDELPQGVTRCSDWLAVAEHFGV